MYHSITFGNKNTWDDWHLIPTSRPVFNPPSPKTIYYDLPGGNGSLDLTDSLLGEPVYNNREGSFEFIVENDYWPSWIDCYTEIMNYLHGRAHKAYLEDEKDYYYNGRFSVNEWKSNNDGTWSNITIDYSVDPYKYEINEVGDDWLWDPFNFETGVIQDTEYVVSGSRTITLECKKMPVVPDFFATSNMKVTFNGKTYALSAYQTKKIYEIRLTQGKSTLTFTGNGKVKISYRNGIL